MAVKKIKKDTKKIDSTAILVKETKRNPLVGTLMLPRNVVKQIADEVVNVVNKQLIRRMPKKEAPVKQKILYPIFLDTSAIIDGRVFDLIKLGVFNGTFIVLESILSELKSIADSKDEVKKERGRKGLKYLDEVKRQKLVELRVMAGVNAKGLAVDDEIIKTALEYKGKIVTCDYNLSKKARISNVVSIDMYEMASILKTAAIPGEEFWIKVIQKGKGEGQGVGYLPDGTMIVVEKGEEYIKKTVKVVVSRIIQTDAGKIFFARLTDESSVR